MKEVEILVKLKSKKKEALDTLSKFDFAGKKEVLDIYFYDKKRESLKLQNNRLAECFRLRKKDGINYLTYKIDKFDASKKWLYSEEEETEIKDFDAAKKIISLLGLTPLVEINNTKYTYYTEEYEIVLEEVKDLGLFLEVEKLKVGNEENVKDLKRDILDFIKSLGLKTGEELNAGKPELMLNK